MPRTIKKIADTVKLYTLNPLIIKSGKKIEQKKFPEIPIIIGACPRSGTTLLLSILGASERIFAVPNQTYAFNRWIEEINPDNGEITYTALRIDRLYREFLYNRIPPKAVRWLEKTPKHVKSYKKILQYLNNRVYIINMIRDGRDVVTSKHPKIRSDRYYLEAERWVEDVNLGLDLEGHPQVLNIRYEDLVDKFEITMHKIYNFIKEEVPESLLSWNKETTIKRSKHWAKPVQGLYKDSIKRWQKPEHKEKIDRFMQNEEAVALLKKLGYL